MKKRTRHIVLLVLLAGLGLISSQAYWLWTTFSIHEAQFVKGVDEALEEALELLIVGHTREVVVRNYSAISKYDSDIQEDKIEQTSVVLIPGDSLNTAKQEIKIAAYYDSSETENGRLRHRFIKRDNQQDTTSHRFPPQMDELMDKVFATLIEKKLDINKLDSIYRVELAKRQLVTDYFIELLDQDSLLATTRPVEMRANYPITASAQGLLPSGYELRATFPQQNWFIFQQLGLVIFTSLLLIIIIIGSFWYMLRVIFEQKKLSEIKNDFINNMTHELKTPISILSAANEALTNFNVLEDRSKTIRYLDIFKKELLRLNTMVEKVLHIAVYEKSSFTLKREAVNVDEVIRSLMDQYDMRHGEEVHFNYNAGIASPILSLDKVHFRNILNNLIDNALKYSKPRHEILIESSETDQAFSIVVTDNGIGISPQHQKIIFDKFYRVPTGDLHSVKGFGLGLSYVKQMVEKHGGTISLNSQVGSGSRFTINMPKL